VSANEKKRTPDVAAERRELDRNAERPLDADLGLQTLDFGATDLSAADQEDARALRAGRQLVAFAAVNAACGKRRCFGLLQ
jgi:hypothetical protein